MNKSIVITIYQKPVEVGFTCIHCDAEVEIDYEEFEKMTSSSLGGIICDSPDFKCPECDRELSVGQAYLD